MLDYTLECAPLDTPIYLIDHQHRIYIGTFTKVNEKVCRGKCIEGDPEYFYRNAIVAWAYK